MKAAVATALKELAEGFPEATVTHQEDDDGGAYVIVDPVDIGPRYEPRSTWIGFHISFAYPEADVYPHFIDGAIQYIGASETPNQSPEGNLPVALSRGRMPGFDRPAIQISRRTKSPDAQTYSALYKLHRVIDLLKRK
jgi:hypothetical protein